MGFPSVSAVDLVGYNIRASTIDIAGHDFREFSTSWER